MYKQRAVRVSGLAIGLTTTVSLLSACSGGNDLLTTFTGKLRIANAIVDSTPVDATVQNLSTGSFQNIAFASGSGFSDIPTGSYKVQLTTSRSGSSITVTNDNTQINADSETTVYAVGNLSAGTQRGFAVVKSTTDVASNQVELQFVHAAAPTTTATGIGAALNVYITAPGVLLPQTPTTTLAAYPSNGNPLLIASGTYEIRISLQSAPNVPIYDSGPAGLILNGGNSLQIATVDDADYLSGGHVYPVQLLVLTAGGGSSVVVGGSS